MRWASVVASPIEFWTITVWRNRHDMQEFMRSGAHDDVMWLFSRWLRSFWLMRWRPGPVERGNWNGLSMAQPEPQQRRRSTRHDDVLATALDHLPRLKAATGSDGAAHYETTPFARRRRDEVGDARGAVVHVRMSPFRTIAAVRTLRRLRRVAEQGDGFSRAVVGVGRPGEAYLLALWRNRAGARRFLDGPAVRSLARRWPDASWSNEWLPENEFGHWDGLRLRRARGDHPIQVPQAALDAAELDAPSAGEATRASRFPG